MQGVKDWDLYWCRNKERMTSSPSHALDEINTHD